MVIERWAFGVSVIAILISISKEVIIPIFFKPKIVLEGTNDDECPDDATANTHSFYILEAKLRSQGLDPKTYPPNVKASLEKYKNKSRWLRLRIKNEGGFFSKTATNCYVKLIEIKNRKNQRIKPFNAFPLMWVSYAISKNNLAKGEYHLLDLVYEIEDERVLYPATYGSFGLPNRLVERKEEKLGPGVYIFKLGVYGDNFNPIFKEIKVELTQNFGELKFAE